MKQKCRVLKILVAITDISVMSATAPCNDRDHSLNLLIAMNVWVCIAKILYWHSRTFNLDIYLCNFKLFLLVPVKGWYMAHFDENSHVNHYKRPFSSGHLRFTFHLLLLVEAQVLYTIYWVLKTVNIMWHTFPYYCFFLDSPLEAMTSRLNALIRLMVHVIVLPKLD